MRTQLMRRSLLVTFALAAAATALAQTDQRPSPAGEPPVQLRQGRAKLIGHFNPQQTLRLAVGLQPPHLAEEEQFLQELMTPGSPNFHKFLTLDRWIARFSPSVEDEQAVVDWAKGQGLTITHRFSNRLIVDLEAPVATIERALGVTINSYAFENYVYFSNDREAVLPANLTGIVHSVGGLTNFPEMHPASFHGAEPPGPVYRSGPVVGKGQSAHGDGNGARRGQQLVNSTSPLASDTTSFTNNLMDPIDIYNSNAYNYDALQNFGFCCNPNHDPSGAPKESSIALATFGNLHTGNNPTFPDIDGFQNQYPYLAYQVTTVIIDGGPSSCTVTTNPPQPCNNDLETALDTEWATATANSFGSHLDTAQVWVYEDGGSTEDMYNAIANDDHARIFSTSWDCSENGSCISNSAMDTRHNIFDQMVGTGWTLMNSSGDRGATADCSTISVNYPASDPDVIGVGGTDNVLFNNTTYNNEVAWTGSTGANSCSTNAGGSGGGCSVHFAVPSFQSGSNGSCGTQRSVPDIALNANEGQNMFFNGSLFGVGGTSISSPMLAGFFAQEGAYLLYLKNVTGNSCGSHNGGGEPCGPMGNGNTYLYYFGQNPNYAPHYPFYDITSGCNSNDITLANKLTAFCAGVGYDSVTGWGSANMLQLAWAINTFIGGDFGAPSVNFSGPAINSWHNTAQTVSWTISDTSSNGAVPIGVAGYSKAWDADVGDNSSESTPGASSTSSFYSGPQAVLGTSGSLVLNNTLEGLHTVHVRTWDNGGTTADHTYGPVGFDDIPPYVTCGSADGLWHATDVSISCSAADSLSGLAKPADVSFLLTTSVPAGTETNNAFTNSHNVLDVAGNSTTAGPIGGNMVDKKPPSITITTPTATAYLLNQSVLASYGCVDGGSGLATCSGPVASGSAIDTSSVGTKTFTVKATDKVANADSLAVNYNVTYRICLLYNPAKGTTGRADYITVQLCDVNGVNVSKMSITLKATGVDGIASEAVSLGNANPGNIFLYGPASAPGASYQYILDTKGLSAGSHLLNFVVQGDPVPHIAPFTIAK